MLDSYVSKRRDRRVVLKVLRKLLSRYGSLAEIDTGKLGSYSAALRNLGIRHRHKIGQYKNNQIGILHLHFRRRERAMGRFRSIASLQKILVHSCYHFLPI
ncbi:transposase [Ahrensia kielensis]|uniref:transposase n=1 Tax=Ahrensia kielensis TaxID=76980 RepID=UPI001FE1DD2A|nr:transposase [Ahrensia kielensis]